MSTFRTHLACWAVVRAAGGDAGFEDDGATAGAWESFAAEDAGKVDVASLFTFGVDVVTVG